MHGIGAPTVRLLAAAALLLAPAAASVHTGRTGAAAPQRLQSPALVSYARAIPSATLGARGKRSLRQATWVGGAHATQSGARVTVFVSPTYRDASAVAQRWAEYVASLLHGAELALARVYIAPYEEVQSFCRATAVLGCYGGNELVSTGDPVGGVTAEEVVRHEYGHHVAAHRQNPPWSAIAWGPKRWASYVDVCRRASGGTAFPGDEGLHYALNPGEAFAEAYRVLNEVRVGAASFSWTLADASFRPDARSLEAVERDVLSPWVQSPPRLLRARFPGGARVWNLSVTTPLDGELELKLTMPLGAGHTLELRDGRGAVLARGAWSQSRQRTLRFQLCGQRTVSVRVTRSGPPRFTLRITAP